MLSLFKRQSDREKDRWKNRYRERYQLINLPFTGLLPKCPQQMQLGQAKAGVPFRSPNGWQDRKNLGHLLRIL